MTSNSPKEWRYSLVVALFLLAPFNLLASLGMDIYLPIVPAMPTLLNSNISAVQLTLTLYMILLGLGQVVFGPLSDRYGRRPVLIAGIICFAIASFGLSASATIAIFIVLRCVQALGAAAMLVAVFATIRDVYAGRPESTAVYSLMNAMLAFVPAVGPILGAMLAALFGWRAIFISLGLPALLLLFLSLPRWHETRKTGAGPGAGGFTALLRNGKFWIYTIAFGAAMGAFFVFFSIAPRLKIEGAGLSEIAFSLAFSTVALIMIVTTRFVVPFSANWGIRGCVMRGLLIMMAGAVLLPVAVWLSIPVKWFFIPAMGVIAIGIVLTSSVTANGALRDFPTIAGTAVALHFCVQSLIVGITGTAFILVLDGSTIWPLFGYIVCTNMLTLVLFGLFTQRQQDERLS